MSVGNDPGARERKKAQTRSAIQEAARTLFAEQGFAATTVAQIADAADIAERTVFRYFESKDALLLPDVHELFESLTRQACARPPQEPPLTALLESLIAVAAGQPSALAVLAQRLDPAPRPFGGQLGGAIRGLESELTEAVRERLAAADPSADNSALNLRAAVIAGVAVATARATLRTFRARRERAEDLPLGELERMLREAFAVVQGGC